MKRCLPSHAHTFRSHSGDRPFSKPRLHSPLRAHIRQALFRPFQLDIHERRWASGYYYYRLLGLVEGIRQEGEEASRLRVA